MSTSTLIKTIIIDASWETVWSFLTEKDKLAIWFHPADKDFVESEDYALLRDPDGGAGDDNKICWGEVVRMSPPDELVCTFTVHMLAGATTTLTWKLEEVFEGTRLTLKHEGIDEAAGDQAFGLLCSMDVGWDKHFAKLRDAASSPLSLTCDEE